MMVLALEDEIGATDRAVMQTYLRQFEVSSGIIANFGKRHLEVRIIENQNRPALVS